MFERVQNMPVGMASKKMMQLILLRHRRDNLDWKETTDLQIMRKLLE